MDKVEALDKILNILELPIDHHEGIEDHVPFVVVTETRGGGRSACLPKDEEVLASYRDWGWYDGRYKCMAIYDCKREKWIR